MQMTGLVDLDGHPLLDPKTGRKMDRSEFQKRSAYGTSVSSRFSNQYQNRYFYQDASRFFNLVNITDKTLWYLDRHGNLSGYDAQTRRQVGNINPPGPGATSSSEPFLTLFLSYYPYSPFDEVSTRILATAHSVYQVDFKARSASAILTLTNDDEIGGGTVVTFGYDEPTRTTVLVTTHKSVRYLDSQGREIFSLPYQPGSHDYPLIRLSLLNPTNDAADKYAVWFDPDSDLNLKSGWKMPIHVAWLSPHGVISKSAELPTLRMPTGTMDWSDRIATALLPLPLQFAVDDRNSTPWILLSLALAIISAVIGWRLMRRYNYSTGASVGWTLFIVLLGVAGLLTLLCVQEWPARELCPKCKKLRAVDRDTCEHCGSTFPPPEKTGTEIFGSLTKV
jgi:hypothetical protein